VELSALIRDAGGYDDQRVTVRGVADNHGPGVFSLVPEGAEATATPDETARSEDPSDDVNGLVVVHELGEGPRDGEVVDVTGEVNDTFDVAAVERTLGIDISDDIVRTLNLGTEDAVLVAESVTPNG
jgi:hypothetical protein